MSEPMTFLDHCIVKLMTVSVFVVIFLMVAMCDDCPQAKTKDVA